MVQTVSVKVVVSIAFWAFLGISSVVLFPVALLIFLLTAPFDRRRVVLHRFTCFWASLYTWTNPFWSVRLQGREKIPRAGTAAVLVANHESFVDILVLFRLFRHFKWVSKAEMFRIPGIGWNMYLNGYVRLLRGDRASIQSMLAEAAQNLRAGSSVIIFPEGTRSPDGRLQEFKRGAFQLALECGVPIVPILLRGTARALPKRGLILTGPTKISVRVLDPIPVASFGTASPEELAESVRARMAKALEGGAAAPSAA
jgi:1-acyl-sn-glycerol-3-phosphate acyltransferase